MLRKGGLLYSERPADLLRKGGRFSPRNANSSSTSSLMTIPTSTTPVTTISTITNMTDTTTSTTRTLSSITKTPTSTTKTIPPSTTTTTTPQPTYEFRTNAPPLLPVSVADISSAKSLSIPLDKLALKSEDLREGVTFDEPQEINAVQLNITAEAISKEKDISDNFKEKYAIYAQTLTNLGFACQWNEASQGGTVQQDILVFFNDIGAENAINALPQVTADLLEATFEESGLKGETEVISVNMSGPDNGSWGIRINGGSGLSQFFGYQIGMREKNLISIISVCSTSLSTNSYSGKTIDDALLLSQNAIKKIKVNIKQTAILTPMPENNRFPNLLTLIPADAADMDNTYFVMNDYEAARETNNVTIPATDTPQDISDYMKALEGMVDQHDYMTGLADFSFISGYNIFSGNTPINIENVGYNLFNTDAEIYTANTEYPIFTANYTDFFTALIGHFDPKATSEAMKNQTNWPKSAQENFNPEIYQNISIYNWNDGANNIENAFMPPEYNRAGNVFPFAVTDNIVLNSGSLTDIKSMIDTESGLNNSIADIKEYEQAAEGLSKLNIYTGIIGSDKISNNGQFSEDTSDAPLLKPYAVFGVGTGTDMLGPYMAIVLVQDDAEKAKENYNLLIDRINSTKWTRPVDWEDSWRLYVDYAQISVEGNVVLAKLYGDRASNFWKDWLYGYYPLLLHE